MYYLELIGIYLLAISQCHSLTCNETKAIHSYKNDYDCDGEEFAIKQCLKQYGWCWCIHHKTGDIIKPYYLVKQQHSKDMTCECASKHQTYNYTTKPKCDSKGNFVPTCFDPVALTIISLNPRKCDFKTGFFKPRHCTNKGCTCQDPLTGTLLTKYHTKDPNLGSNMNCKCAIDEFHSKKKDDTYCLPNGNYGSLDCISVRKRALSQKCSLNLFTPICDSNGKYFIKQCFGTRCFCVDPETGKHIGHYSAIKSTVKETDMTCECAYKEFIGGTKRICQTNGNELTECQKLQRNKNYLLGLFNPSCDADGSYSARQCHRTKCHCHSKHGVKLGAYIGSIKSQMNCRCARDENTYKNENFQCTLTGDYESLCVEKRTLSIRNSEPNVPKCQSDGSFAPVQCNNNTCFCADPSSGQALGHYTFAKNSSLEKSAKCDCALKEFKTKKRRNCYFNGNELTECQEKRKMALLNAVFRPDCEDDGTYSPQQCYLDMCWCADRRGIQIGSYSFPMGSANTECRCARDQAEYVNENLYCTRTGSYKSKCLEMRMLAIRASDPNPYICASDGTFGAVHCNANNCFCIDTSTGKKLGQYSFDHQTAQTGNITCDCARDENIFKNYSFDCTDTGNYKKLCLDIRRKSHQSPNAHLPTCLPNGFFSPVQCNSKECYCVNTVTGQKLKQYIFVRNSLLQKSATCDCALKEHFTNQKRNCHINGNELTSCQKERQMALDGAIFKPSCDADGSFSARQCYLNNCWCAADGGTQIGHYTSSVRSTDSDCRCARDLVKYGATDTECSNTGNYKSKCIEMKYMAIRKLSSYIPQCASDGSFHPIQCYGNRCFCIDSSTGLRLQPYSFDKNSALANNVTCDCARDERLYRKNGLKFTVRCMDNGNYESCFNKLNQQSFKPINSTIEKTVCNTTNNSNYEPVQCDDKRCYCTNIYGHHISMFSVPISHRSKLTDCQCALDKDENFRSGSKNKVSCDKYGNYTNDIIV